MINTVKYKLNYDLSKKVYLHNKFAVQKNECYNNVARIIIRDYFININNVHVCFGAWKIDIDNDYFYAKHCFFEINGHIIDPTFFICESDTSKEKASRIDYMIFKKYTLDEYNVALEENNYDPSLLRSLWKFNNKLTFELASRGIMLL